MKNFYWLILIAFISTNLNAQRHHIGIKAGYARSSASIPNETLYLSNNGLSHGNDWFDGSNGFQLGVVANINVGSKFFHIDVVPQYSRYGFESDEDKFGLDYLDVDVGLSNLYCKNVHKIFGGFGFTPSFLIASENIANTNDFDLKFYLLLGFRFSKAISAYAQGRFGLIEIVPDSEINNFQFSLNLNVSVFEL